MQEEYLSNKTTKNSNLNSGKVINQNNSIGKNNNCINDLNMDMDKITDQNDTKNNKNNSYNKLEVENLIKPLGFNNAKDNNLDVNKNQEFPHVNNEQTADDFFNSIADSNKVANDQSQQNLYQSQIQSNDQIN